jgi:hypothetical protein
VSLIINWRPTTQKNIPVNICKVMNKDQVPAGNKGEEGMMCQPAVFRSQSWLLSGLLIPSQSKQTPINLRE